jgi:hypothetical protein
MIMLDPNNKIYGSLGLADNYVMKTEEGTKLALSNPKLGSFADVLTEFNIYGHSEQESTTGANLIDVDSMLNECLVKNADDTYSILKTETNRFSKSFPVNLKAGTKVSFNADVIEYNGVYNLKLQVNTGYGTISVGKTLTLKSDITDVTIYQDGNNDVGTYTKFKNAILSVGEAKVPYEPYTGGKPSPSLDYPQEIKSVVNPTVKVTNEDGTQFETANLTYMLNAIPVASGGNVTIDGQQWICDEVDLERGVKVQRVKSVDISSLDKSFWIFRNDIDANVSATRYSNEAVIVDFRARAPAMSNILPLGVGNDVNTFRLVATPLYLYQFNLDSSKFPTVKSWVEYLEANTVLIIYALATPIETPLTPAEIAAFNVFTTYYPVTIVENNYNTWMKATYKSTESV